MRQPTRSVWTLMLGLVLTATSPADTRPVPAQRIVALSPHATELVFAAGAGERLVGVVAYSDHPAEALTLPRVGDAARLDRERIFALAPDLVIAWTSGNRATDLSWLEQQGVAVYRSDPQRLEEIADQIEDIGALAGTQPAARDTADRFRTRLRNLRTHFDSETVVAVFYQLWAQPLMTVDDRHLISQVLDLCGARNIFPSLPGSAAAVDIETVIAANPQAIIAGREAKSREDPLAQWRAWKELEATRRGNLFTVSADLLHRPTPRILDGVEQVCAQLARARHHRDR